MFRINASRNMLLCIVGTAIILLLVSGFVYHSQAAKLQSMQAEISEKQKKLEHSESIAKRLSVVEQNYQDAQAILGVLEQGVSTKAYVPTLLRQIEELGKSVNLRVVGVRPKTPPAKPVVASDQKKDAASGDEGQAAEEKEQPEPYDTLEIDVEIHGKYWDVVRFLEEITSFPKIIAVNSVQLSPIGQPEEVASPMLSVRLNTTAFILKEPTDKRAKRVVADQANSDGRRI